MPTHQDERFPFPAPWRLVRELRLRRPPWWMILALVIVVGILGGALVALTLILLGWGYNLVAWLTGGLEVQLQEIPTLAALPSDDDKAIAPPPVGNDEG